MSVSPVAQHIGAGVRSLTPIHLVSLCFLACGMRLYTCNLFKMLSWLQQFKFHSFGRTVIQFVLVYLETQQQYIVKFM